MKNSVEFYSETEANVVVEVSAEDFEPAYEKAAKKLAKQVNIPGFRPGKAPRRVLEANIGKGYIIEQAINDNLDSYYQQAVVDNELKPLSRPEVQINEVPEMKGKGDSTALKFAVQVEVAPEISLIDPAELSIEVDAADITDDDVQKALDELRERFATLREVDREAHDGDHVNIDLVAKVDGEEVDDMAGVSYKIGDGNMLDGQDDALKGAKAGDVVEFETKLAGGEHAGEEAVVTITLNSVKESDLPEADDEFAQMASEFDTLDELKDDLKKKVIADKQREQAMQAENKIIEALLEKVDVPLPQGVIDDEIANHLENEGKSAGDSHGDEIREDIEKQLKLQLLLDDYAAGFDVKVEQQDLLNFMIQQSQMYGMDPSQFIQAAAEANQVSAFAGEIARNKAVLAIMRGASVKDSNGADVDFADLFGEAEETEKTPEYGKASTRTFVERPAKTESEPSNIDDSIAAVKSGKAEASQSTEVETPSATTSESSEDEVAEAQIQAPAKSALKAEWIKYRVATTDLTEAQAKKLTKDELIEYQG